MRRSMLAAVSAAALIAAVAATFTGANAFADDPGSADAAEAPTADQLRDRVEGCETQVSDGLYAERVGMEHDIPVCGTGNAIHWKSGMTIDCDGQSTDNCNSSTDGSYQPETSCVQSDGDYLVADQLPFAVVPLPSSIWDAQNSGIDCGTVVAAVYEDTVVYGVVGDRGPDEQIGEASYAMAEALGIDPDPSSGGISGKVVDYIAFPDETAVPLESNEEAVKLGEAAAEKLLSGCVSYGFEAYPDLASGAEGKEVSAAQCLLAELGFPIGDGGKPTGVFDEETVAVVKEFQTKVGLEASGKIDKHTWTAMLSAGETPELSDGSSGADVSRLQRALTAALGQAIDQDGLFGSKTEQAVKDYQTAVGVDPSGTVTAETWEKLQAGA